VKSIKWGDPTESDDLEMGSMIAQAQAEKVDAMVERARGQSGVEIVVGGKRPARAGAYYEPTLIAGPAQDSEIVQDEVFGPVLAVLPFDTLDEALEMANDTRYGLAASIWTANVFSAMEAARTLDFGHVQVNDHLMVTSEMPHGGFKQSGTGKDMSSYSFEEYTQVKHVMLELTGEPEKGWHYTIFGDKRAE
jgi:betaine-aldehyde dehydrogenase